MPTPAETAKQKVQRWWDESKANQALLQSCPRHDFQQVGDRVMLSDEVCANCGGKVNATAARWYRKGISHANTR